MFDEFGFPRDANSDYAAPILGTFVYCSRAAEGVDDAEVMFCAITRITPHRRSVASRRGAPAPL